MTDLSEIENNFGINFGVDFGLFVLYFPEFYFYKFLVKKKKNRALYS